MIDKLEYLMALAREEHFGRAADACGVTQPTLSAAIKQLESELGVMLVQRSARFIGLTPEGERTLNWARRIVRDSRSLRQEIKSLKHGLSGRIRIAAIPSALPMVAALTTPYRIRHPNVQFTVLSKTSSEILELLENLEIDSGISYLDNEPLGRLHAVPLYRERYQLITAKDSPFGSRAKVTWAEVAQIPLCLLTPGMQNNRMVEQLLRADSGDSRPTLESNVMIVLLSHVRTGRWASVLPQKVVEIFGLSDEICAIPISDPEIVHTVGLVVPEHEPTTPLIAALVSEARRAAPKLDS